MKEYFRKLKYLFRWRDVLFALALLGIIVSMGLCRAQDLIDVSLTDADVTVTTARYSMNIPFDMVESVEIVPIDKDDVELDGMGDITLRTGLWENAQWGEYYACVDMQTRTCVKARLNDGRIFVFSAHSDKFVQECYDAMEKALTERATKLISGKMLAYIESLEPGVISFDQVEYVDVPSARATELQVSQDAHPVFYIHNEVAETETFSISENCTCKVFDWGNGHESMEVTLEELMRIHPERRAAYGDTYAPYHVTIENNEVVEISELYLS